MNVKAPGKHRLSKLGNRRAFGARKAEEGGYMDKAYEGPPLL